MTAAATLPMYNLASVEHVILTEIIEQHPARLTVDELSLRIVADPADSREVEVATDAIRNLRRSGLIRYRNDDLVVEPTHTALRAAAVLTLG
jgi:hypothetical protein